MKRFLVHLSMGLSLVLGLVILASCQAADATAPETPQPSPASSRTVPPQASSLCRVVDQRDGTLLLAEEGGGEVYYLAWGEEIPAGSRVEVLHSGDILETFPAQFASVQQVQVLEEGFHDLCALYLQVLEDLWKVDPGLNSEITQLSVDLSQTRLSPSEQSAVAIAFGSRHGIFPMELTWDELEEQGYIQAPDEFPHWEEGCLFSIKEGEECTEDSLVFHAEKWRSALGAYFFHECTSFCQNGSWDGYQIGAEMIS